MGSSLGRLAWGGQWGDHSPQGMRMHPRERSHEDHHPRPCSCALWVPRGPLSVLPVVTQRDLGAQGLGSQMTLLPVGPLLVPSWEFPWPKSSDQLDWSPAWISTGDWAKDEWGRQTRSAPPPTGPATLLLWESVCGPGGWVGCPGGPLGQQVTDQCQRGPGAALCGARRGSEEEKEKREKGDSCSPRAAHH